MATATENWKVLWKSFRSVADALRTPADDGQSWAQLIPRILTRFQEFVKRCAQLCTKNVLAPVRVLAPEAPLSKIAEEAESQEYLDAVEKKEPNPNSKKPERTTDSPVSRTGWHQYDYLTNSNCLTTPSMMAKPNQGNGSEYIHNQLN